MTKEIRETLESLHRYSLGDTRKYNSMEYETIFTDVTRFLWE